MNRIHFACVASPIVLAIGVAAGTASADGEPYRETYPHAQIDPARGFEGDVGFSDTIQYWRSEQALQRHAGWVGDPEQQWRLNWKFMDLDRVDLHPGHFAVDTGAARATALARRDPRFLSCLGEGGEKLAGLAASYPKYDAALGRVVTVEDRIESCAAAAPGEKVPQGSVANNEISVWFKSLSAGTPIRVDIGDARVMAAYRRGETLFYAKTGQLNFACASCHVPGSIMGHRLRGETPTTPFADAAHYPTYRTPVSMLESIQQRFARCHGQMRTQALAPGDPAYVDLEVFMTVLSNGYPMSVPSAR
ncbi:MAG: sulfur oxidation c-type cytochrome SoxA [Lautropia sp.]|nr:MAG: sulfur oxidation c-type cytochrome SoxA [Pseudomonadota bacterium]MBC6959704.1 sulfur oxidation c-type cytochrome SoxA [Lautropia sp.]MCL4701592.1 sulfur oxidation c-type cytochrome SoxA [Burkholderiaceae bacterium]MDL1906188.1 sulfur oxidation c-type cytochrome SoxA [Betaproteobacteria bacterium PRO1]MEB2335949.1 sulfur oxidation c-type cytochrome SoxA [Burkholderiales bacterium]